jgi:hypothetical protein
MVNSFVFFHYIFSLDSGYLILLCRLDRPSFSFISVISSLLCAMVRSMRMSRFQYSLISSFSIIVCGLYLYHGSVISVS